MCTFRASAQGSGTETAWIRIQIYSRIRIQIQRIWIQNTEKYLIFQETMDETSILLEMNRQSLEPAERSAFLKSASMWSNTIKNNLIWQENVISTMYFMQRPTVTKETVFKVCIHTKNELF